MQSRSWDRCLRYCAAYGRQKCEKQACFSASPRSSATHAMPAPAEPGVRAEPQPELPSLVCPSRVDQPLQPLPPSSPFGRGDRGCRIAHHESGCLLLMEVPPGRQNAHVPVGNLLALFLKNRIGKGDQFCSGHRSQDFFEVVPAHFVFRVEVGVQLSRGSCGKGAQLLQNAITRRSLRARRSAKPLRNTTGRCAKIAHSAARTVVRGVPEVVNQTRHPATMTLREADDLLDLALLLLRLHRVGSSPMLLATAHISA